MRELTCIRCPKGCRLQVEDNLQVQGAGCPKGISYAEEETTHPVRTVTATVRLQDAALSRLPVRSSAPVPKEKVMDVVQALQNVQMKAPVEIGSVVLANVSGTGVDIVATRSVR